MRHSADPSTLALHGGTPVREELLVYGRPSLGEAELAEVAAAFESGWIGTGPRAARFEAAFCGYLGADHGVAVSSCTAALQLSLLAAGVGPGDEVVVPTMTYAATANAVLQAGAAPVLVDVEPRSLTLAPEAVEAAVTARTRAVVPVHFGGHPCDMAGLEAVARQHGLAVVEDAAHCIEGWSGHRKVGTIGDFTCFSFSASKNLTTVEGGMVTTADADAADRIRTMAGQGLSAGTWDRFADGRTRHAEVVAPGFRAAMSDVNAAIGLAQLRQLHARSARRREIWDRYDEALADLPVRRPALPAGDGDAHARHLYVLRLCLDRLRADRDAVVAALAAENVGVGVHYRALHLHPLHRSRAGVDPAGFPAATPASAEVLSLPLSGTLSDADVDDVVAAVEKVLSAYGG